MKKLALLCSTFGHTAISSPRDVTLHRDECNCVSQRTICIIGRTKIPAFFFPLPSAEIESRKINCLKAFHTAALNMQIVVPQFQ